MLQESFRCTEMRQIEEVSRETDQALLNYAQGPLDWVACHTPEPPPAQSGRELLTLPWIVILVSVTFALLALYLAALGSR